jgi:hypothetical protein
MNYTKPQITSLASASFVIQGGMGKSVLNNPDSTEPVKTPSAYEADE